MSFVSKNWKGILVCFCIAVPSWLLGQRFPIIGGPVIAILAGMVLTLGIRDKSALESGIKYTSKKILQYAVILLGFGLNLQVILQTGKQSLPIIFSTIATSLIIAYVLHRAMRIPGKISTLVGVGSSICGGSAIAATAPVIDADDEEVAQAISVIFFFNVLAAILFPTLGGFLGFATNSGEAFGVFAGTAVNDTSSVTAAASTWDSLYGLGSQTLDKAVTVKLTRTLAIILYGDLDISVIDELPANRLPIKNCVVDTGYRKTAYTFMKKEIAAGRQCYVICPMVEESEQLEAENVQDYGAMLQEEMGPDIRVACLHGKMKPALKDEIMEAFGRNEIQILVSTTVIEVGIDVPNATVMMIENAERFGLAQLHQLRGRVGRGKHQSYCIFMSASRAEETKERLSILRDTNDGFKIASEDLRLRGPGDLFGIRQSGLLNFRLGDVFQDAKILQMANEAADEILKNEEEWVKNLPEYEGTDSVII